VPANGRSGEMVLRQDRDVLEGLGGAAIATVGKLGWGLAGSESPIVTGAIGDKVANYQVYI